MSPGWWSVGRDSHPGELVERVEVKTFPEGLKKKKILGNKVFFHKIMIGYITKYY